jgi:hypothetical protein
LLLPTAATTPLPRTVKKDLVIGIRIDAALRIHHLEGDEGQVVARCLEPGAIGYEPDARRGAQGNRR